MPLHRKQKTYRGKLSHRAKDNKEEQDPRRKIGNIAKKFTVAPCILSYDELSPQLKQSIIEDTLYRIFREDLLTVMQGVDLLELILMTRDQYLKKVASLSTVKMAAFTCYCFYTKMLLSQSGSDADLELIQDDVISQLVEHIKAAAKQYPYSDRRNKRHLYKKIINEISEKPFLQHMIIDCQLLLPGLDEAAQAKVIDYRIARYMKFLNLVNPILMHDAELSELVQDILKKSITYNYTAENIQNWTKHRIILNTSFSFVNSQLHPYHPPTIFVKSLRNDQNVIVKKAIGEEQFKLMQLQPVWKDLEKWADRLDKRIKPKLHLKTAATIVLLLLAAYFYEKLSNSSLSILVSTIVFAVMLEHYWHRQISGENSFDKAELDEAVKMANRALTIQKIELYDSEKQQETIVVASLEDVSIDPFSSLYNPYSPLSTGAMTFLSYARSSLGLSTRDAVKLRKELQHKPIEKAFETPAEINRGAKLIYSWFDGAIRSNMLAVVPVRNLSRFYVCIDQENINESKADKIYSDALTSILMQEGGPPLGGEGRCIALLAAPIPGSVKINGISYKVQFTHKVRDPDFNYRLYCYQMPKAKGEGGPSLIVACTVLDDHKHAPTSFSIKNFNTEHLNSTFKGKDALGKDEEVVANIKRPLTH